MLLVGGGVFFGISYISDEDFRNDFHTTPAPATIDSVEHEIWALTNEYRAVHGLPPLRRIAAIDGIARGHSEDMLVKGYFSHDSPAGLDPTDRALAAGYPCDKGDSYGLAENIFNVSNTALHANVADEIVTGWMNSPGHRQNMLDPSFDRIGVGVTFKARTVYATQNFC